MNQETSQVCSSWSAVVKQGSSLLLHWLMMLVILLCVGVMYTRQQIDSSYWLALVTFACLYVSMNGFHFTSVMSEHARVCHSARCRGHQLFCRSCSKHLSGELMAHLLEEIEQICSLPHSVMLTSFTVGFSLTIASLAAATWVQFCAIVLGSSLTLCLLIVVAPAFLQAVSKSCRYELYARIGLASACNYASHCPEDNGEESNSLLQFSRLHWLTLTTIGVVLWVSCYMTDRTYLRNHR